MNFRERFLVMLPSLLILGVLLIYVLANPQSAQQHPLIVNVGFLTGMAAGFIGALSIGIRRWSRRRAEAKAQKREDERRKVEAEDILERWAKK